MNNGQMYLHKDLTKIAVIRRRAPDSPFESAFIYNLGTGRRTAVYIRPENLVKHYRPISN
ncbi:hypothetical protein [Streptomyces sp. NPDC018584]|uniref:hypothetical protein n=1 Tax=unclassified Streptomyces TaxID=2593676 RepID=UPI0037A588EA